jgi:Concanavalin A-like lectin/glucanases superfamily
MAANFNGTSDVYGTAGNAAALDISNNQPMSLVCWVNLATLSPAAQGGIVSKGFDGSNTAYSFAVSIGPPSISWGSFTGNTTSHGTVVTLAALGWSVNTWHHIYGDYTGSGTTTWNFYADGAFVGSSVDATGPVHTTKRFSTGATDINGAFGQWTAACIADVAVFNGPLTTTEIGHLGNGTLRPNTGMSQTLLGYWPLTAGGHSQADTSGNGNTITAGATDPTTCASSPAYQGGSSVILLGKPVRRFVRR